MLGMYAMRERVSMWRGWRSMRLSKVARIGVNVVVMLFYNAERFDEQMHESNASQQQQQSKKTKEKYEGRDVKWRSTRARPASMVGGVD